MRLIASGTRIPWGNFQLSCTGVSGLLDSEQALLRSLLMFRCAGRPRSINKVVSDTLRLCCAVGASRGSRFSIRGEFRLDAGDAVGKRFDAVEEGAVAAAAPVFGDRLGSEALSGVWPPDEIGVRVVLLGRELSLAGDGEPLRSTEEGLGGTRGGSSKWSGMLTVSSFNTVLGLTPGLMMGDSGLPVLLGWSDPKGDAM
jgi:hypothetical protein